MHISRSLIAASLAVLPLMLWGQAQAAGPLMAAPLVAGATDTAALAARLRGADVKRGLDPDHGYRVERHHPGVDGTRITRMAHTYKGVRVFQSESVLVTNDIGKIVSESASDRRAGLGYGPASATMGGRFAAFSVQPAISASAALNSVATALAPRAIDVTKPSAELIVYPLVASVRVPAAVNKTDGELNALDLEEQVTGYELAYLVRTRMLAGGRPLYRDSIVSATDGRVRTQWNALQTAVGSGYSQYNGTLPLSTTLSGGIYLLRDPLRGSGGTFGAMTVTNADHGTTAGSIYTSLTDTWGDGQQYIAGGSTINANGQTAAVNAMWGVMNTYDMLRNTLGWRSLDGNDTSTYIAVHVNTAYDNAYYDDTCRCMFIGDGSSFTNLGSIDVIGHEMSHGVTAATSNLTYFGESGGLNESSSDIGGEVTEAYARAGGTGTTIPSTGNDWLIGAEISRTGTPLRWMYKPGKDGMSPDAWRAGLGNLDVHYISGPNNRMFYFLAQGSEASTSSERYSSYLTRLPRAMTGIGTGKAFRIWFRANTTKFTASTNYADARAKVLLAAQELYGTGSREAIAVQRAYAAINVGIDIDEAGSGASLSIIAQPANVTVAPGATATFAVTASGGAAPYRYQWLRNGAAIAGATGPTYSVVPLSADNGAGYSVRISDSATSPSSVTSATATLTVLSSSATERIRNGSFESGSTGWSGSTSAIGSHAGQAPYDGVRYAWLGGNGFGARELISQPVSIPAEATSAKLSFALHIDTAEDNAPNMAYDRITLSVRNAAGEVLRTLASYTNLSQASGYQMRRFSLLAYKGQTVILTFDSREDFSLQTSFVIDKVSVLTE
ncbi:M4 family metallopeptidase [Massilia sp. TWR1-2-2]|uniref:M4 family metallopeptidase n=1 Tax=Massilia sp. TWR1-2-2 TaxID=2804584 RepID=UPI003CE6BD2D